MSFLQNLKERFSKKDENVEQFLQNEVMPSEDIEDEQDNISVPDEDAPEDDAKTVKGKLVKGIAFGVAAIAVGAVVSNMMSTPKHNPQGKESTDLSANTITANPAQGIPDNYADIAKYQAKNNKQQPIKPVNAEQRLAGQQQGQPYNANHSNAYRPVYESSSSYMPTNNAGNYSHGSTYNSGSDARQLAQQQAKIAASPILFDISKFAQAAASMSTANAAPAPMQTTNDSYDTGFTLYAGTVIPATLLTGVTSEVNNGDVVAQVRQDVYDSLTGMHLLIPQGSRLIGVSGAAGSRGNKCIGVAFKRIIFPNGYSVQLPDQKAIDGTGFPGLRDKYDDHASTLYRTAFLGALLAAAAQSSTGNSSGYDSRSPGQEAVSGAVAEVLDTAHTIVERDANMAPTITITPGAQFSVFINADIALMEYLY